MSPLKKMKDKVAIITGGGCGTFGGYPKANSAAFKKAGINSQFYVSPLTADECQSWWCSLHELTSLLIK